MAGERDPITSPHLCHEHKNDGRCGDFSKLLWLSYSWTDLASAATDNSLTAQSDEHFPTTLTPKSLFNYNITAAAKTAAVSLRCLVKEKSISKAKTERELDERRRLLLRQSEQIKARYGVQPCN
jgi:hypothetical protein